MIYYPATFYDAGAVILVVGGCLVAQGARLQTDPIAVNINRISEGTAGLAVVTLVLHEAANDLRGGFGELLRFFGQLPSAYAILPPLVLLSMGGLALLAFFSAFRLYAGLGAPLIGLPSPTKRMRVGRELLWLVVVGALWRFGVFVPQDWEWGRFGAIINLALRGFYLFALVDAAVSLAILFGGGNIGGIMARHQRERNAPLRPVQQPGNLSGGKRAWQLFDGAFELAFWTAVVVFGAFVLFVPGRAVFGFLLDRLLGVAIIVGGLWGMRYELRKRRPVLPPRIVALLDRWNIR